MVLFLFLVKGIPPPHMNWSAIHTNTVYSSVFEICLLKNLLCCKSNIPGIWNWPCATVSTCKLLKLLSAFPSWLCASTAFMGIVTYLFCLLCVCVSETRHLIVPCTLSKKEKKHESWIRWSLVALHPPETSPSFPNIPNTLSHVLVYLVGRPEAEEMHGPIGRLVYQQASNSQLLERVQGHCCFHVLCPQVPFCSTPNWEKFLHLGTVGCYYLSEVIKGKWPTEK